MVVFPFGGIEVILLDVNDKVGISIDFVESEGRLDVRAAGNYFQEGIYVVIEGVTNWMLMGSLLVKLL